MPAERRRTSCLQARVSLRAACVLRQPWRALDAVPRSRQLPVVVGAWPGGRWSALRDVATDLLHAGTLPRASTATCRHLNPPCRPLAAEGGAGDGTRTRDIQLGNLARRAHTVSVLARSCPFLPVDRGRRCPFVPETARDFRRRCCNTSLVGPWE